MLKPMTAVVALAVSAAPIASLTSPAAVHAAVAAPQAKPAVVAKAQVQSVAKATHLTNTQVTNARTIIGVAVNQKLPRQAAVIAVATALTESGLRNHHYGDRDSEGLFQQRPSQGWGTVEQVTNPKHAARRFLDALQHVPDWQKLPVTKAAQDVQHSAFPTAYAKWAPLAKKLVNALLPPTGTTKSPTVPADPSGATAAAACTVRQARKRPGA